MKKIKGYLKTLFLSTTIIFSLAPAVAQTGRDTVKPGHANDPMNVNPGKVDDGMAVKPANPHDGMSVLSDTGFLSKNIMDNELEIQLSKLGQERGTNPATKKAAATMLTDHTAMLHELQTLAGAKPGAVTEPGRENTMPPTKFPEGKDFDAAWAGEMLTMHIAKITELESFISVSKNSSLKAAVLKAIPKLKAHRELLRQIPGAKDKSGTTQTI